MLIIMMIFDDICLLCSNPNMVYLQVISQVVMRNGPFIHDSIIKMVVSKRTMFNFQRVCFEIC